MKRIILIVIGALLTAMLGWSIFTKIAQVNNPSQMNKAAQVAVEIGPITREAVVDRRMFTGTLEAESYFIVAPKVAGRLEKLTVDIGDTLNTGDVIAQLDSLEYEQQVQQAQAELQVAHAQLEESQASQESIAQDLQRDRSLREQKIISQSDLDGAEARFKVGQAKVRLAQAAVQQKEAMLGAAKVRLSYSRIVASWPDNGRPRVVGERYVDVGAMLRANDPILSVVDISSLRAVLHVPERDFASVEIGQVVDIVTDAVPGRVFQGKVRRIAPVVQTASRQVRVEVEVPNDDNALKPGLFVRTFITYARRNDVLTVPQVALAKRQGGTGVFVVDTAEKVARFVPVMPGIVQNGRVEILKPLDISGFVVTLGQHIVNDGSPVRIVNAPGPVPESGK